MRRRCGQAGETTAAHSHQSGTDNTDQGEIPAAEVGSTCSHQYCSTAVWGQTAEQPREDSRKEESVRGGSSDTVEQCKTFPMRGCRTRQPGGSVSPAARWAAPSQLSKNLMCAARNTTSAAAPELQSLPASQSRLHTNSLHIGREQKLLARYKVKCICAVLRVTAAERL